MACNRAVEVLDRLGALGELPERGLPIQRVVVNVHARHMATLNVGQRTSLGGRVLLAGDAAHIHSPFGGQGMNTGIGDAENLAWKLALVASGRADERLLDTYEAERRPIAEDVLSTTSGLTEMVIGDGRIARLLRYHVAVPLLNRRWTQRLITDKSSQLQISYRRGPLGSRSMLPTKGPQPGDRIPDRTCTDRAGLSIRLYDAVGPRWALVGPGRFGAFDDIVSARLDAAILDGTGDAMLIRPDGHLAWRGSDPDALRAWLYRALGSRAGTIAV